MTIEELHLKLKELGVSEDKYYLHGLYGSGSDDDRLSLTIKRGAFFVEYEIYTREKGEKHLIVTFTNEDQACQYFYKRLKEYKELQEQFNK